MKHLSYFVLRCLIVLLCLTSCSSDEETDPTDPANNIASTAPPNDLVFVNMSFGGVGERAPVINCDRLPRSGEDFIRTRLNLPTETLLGLYGVNYNRDGSFPDGRNLIEGYDDLRDNRNKLTLSFAVVDEARADATLTIRNLMFSGNNGFSIVTCFKGSFGLQSGVFEITPKPGFEDRTAGFDKITFTIEDFQNTSSFLNMIIAGDLSQSNMTVPDFQDLVERPTVEIPILMIENSKVENGEFTFVRFLEE
jgi:hypothetical protein